MVKSAKSQLEEEEQSDDYDDLVAQHNLSSKGELMKADGKGNEQKSNSYRSKHSETEQRRRSKINDRFQILRDLIPQNDQKRDKASFLLEVIEYIQFLQEKLRVYEGPYQGWSQEPTKLMPWQNHQGPPENFGDHSQVFKNGSCENNVARNSVESDLGTASIYEALDHPSGTATPVLPPNTQIPSNMYGTVGSSGMPAQSLQESVPDAAAMAFQSQSQLWKGRPLLSNLAVPDDTSSGQEELSIESGSINISSAYSQGLLNSLTQALQSLGVDLSQASISVQIDVGKRATNGSTAMTSGSKDHENPLTSNHLLTQTGDGTRGDDSNRAHKRLRTEKS
ncbi:hypothetical protein HS088_TW04G00863 [Tripterygium wilfordii]|uniref:BHLH domain-containing protein n=1 Tax=Tripterygium wilfordii TaxID=458696 RepID=A0A7J7DR79_TRIWF|nr:transcription factor BIM2-like [Tripterygium wilfordii]XP_038699006.1 transcription factor BIM2-like [Tripterygium wilfordii]XP_038699007.1 transcription factor BIM2-like [Tripterygium wilfordii]KAF5748902.1 hypothetical protein HS088_TW04G00863 [Tripterygium wilfordii]